MREVRPGDRQTARKTEGRKKEKKKCSKEKINIRKPALKGEKIFASIKDFSVSFLQAVHLFLILSTDKLNRLSSDDQEVKHAIHTMAF